MRKAIAKPIEAAKNAFAALSQEATNRERVLYYSALKNLAQTIDNIQEELQKYPDDRTIKKLTDDCHTILSSFREIRIVERHIMDSSELTPEEKIKMLRVINGFTQIK